MRIRARPRMMMWWSVPLREEVWWDFVCRLEVDRGARALTVRPSAERLAGLGLAEAQPGANPRPY